MTAPPAPDDPIPLPCPHCGYDLRGTGGSGVCPECGESFDAHALATTAAIPWQHRREIGRLRAFRRTVWMALRRPGELARQAGRPVDYAAARRFQLICVGLAWLAVAPPVVWGAWAGLRMLANTSGTNNLMSPPDPSAGESLSFSSWLADAGVVAALAAGLLAWLLTASGVAGYFFHKRDRPVALQDRAVALSYYAAAPLALVPMATVLIALTAAVSLVAGYIEPQSAPADHPMLLSLMFVTGAAYCVVLLLIILMLLILPAKLLAVGTQASAGRVAACLAVVAVAWPLLFVVFVVGPPLLIFYSEVVWQAFG